MFFPRLPIIVLIAIGMLRSSLLYSYGIKLFSLDNLFFPGKNLTEYNYQRYKTQIRKILQARFNFYIPPRDVYESLKQPDIAEILQKLDPLIARYPLLRAEIYFKQGKYQEAIDTLEEQLPLILKGLHPYYQFHLGKYYYFQKKFKLAISKLEPLFESHVTHAFQEELGFFLLKAYEAVNQFPALHHLLQTQGFSFKNPSFQSQFYQLEVKVYIHAKDYPSLAKLVLVLEKDPDHLAKVFPSYATYSAQLNPILKQLKSKPDKPKAPENPQDIDRQLAVIKTTIQKRDFEGAKQLMGFAKTNILKYSPHKKPTTCELMLLEMALYLQMRAKETEIATSKNFLKQCPTHYSLSKLAAVTFNIGKRYWNLDDNKNAQLFFEQTIKLFPQTEPAKTATYTLGLLLQNDGKFDAAADWFKKFHSGYPDEEKDALEDAFFNHGFSLFLAGKFPLAQAIFSENPTNPKHQFWLAKTQQKLGNDTAFKTTLAQIINRDPFNYYAIRAHMLQGTINNSAPSFFKDIHFDYPIRVRPPKIALNNLVHLQTAERLLSIGFMDYASHELQRVKTDTTTDPKFRIYLAVLNFLSDNFLQSVILFNQLLNEEVDLPPDFVILNYPIRYIEQISTFAKRNNLHPEFVLSLTRQESLFDPKAKSPANALGLMQLIPSTAKRVGKNLSADYFDKTESKIQSLVDAFLNEHTAEYLYDPYLNIALGTKHLHALFQEDLPKALGIASYNAGKTKVRQWVKQLGIADLDTFIERIPYQETRNYTKIVIRNYYNYQRLFKGGVSSHLFANDFQPVLPAHNPP